MGHSCRDGSKLNTSSNPTFDEILKRRLSRRGLPQGTASWALAGSLPLPPGGSSSNSGLLAINNEYTDNGLLHTDGFAIWSADKVRKAQNAHLVIIVEVHARDDGWEVVRPSRYAQRGVDKAPAGTDGANPRTANSFGHIIRWREEGGDPAALNFEWDISWATIKCLPPTYAAAKSAAFSPAPAAAKSPA